jgi:DNA helicase-2/ATP-dependent DNA helicase PcrA
MVAHSVLYIKSIKVHLKRRARVVYDEYSESPIRPGIKVRHICFGVGTLIRLLGQGDNQKWMFVLWRELYAH